VGSYGVGLWITSPRMPAAGETVLGHDFMLGHGGKGSNQAVGITRLGQTCRFLARVGEDKFGREAMDMWRMEGLDTSAVKVSQAVPTMAGFILLSEDGENRIITDPGANAHLTPADVEAFDAAIAGSRVLLTQMEIPLETVAAALRAARRHGVTTILNPAPAQSVPADVLANVDVLTPNQGEARILLGLAPDDPTPDAEIARRLFGMGVGTLVLTLGARGAMILSADGAVEFPSPKVDVVDTTGAGDGFNAALAAGVAQGLDLPSAVSLGTRAGAFIVTRAGVLPALPTFSDLRVSKDLIPETS
jgi:ribokinase